MTGRPAVPKARRAAAEEIARALAGARRVTVATHVNADGDGAGSEAALAHALGDLGVEVAVVNPTPFPETYRFLLPRGARALGPGREAAESMRAADLQLVVDTSEPSRLGDLEPHLDAARGVVIDHHAVGQRRIDGRLRLIDPAACAAGELVYDVLAAGGLEIGRAAAQALYVAIVTDTGSFRYANATPRAHALAGHFIALGVEPEAIFRRIYASVSEAQLQILRAALESLSRDPEYPVTWIRLPRAVTERWGDLDDWEPILEPARTLEGTQVAAFLRELGDGRVKLSLRSNGDVDVAAVAHALGGGGHEKAAGAELAGSLDDAAARVRAALGRAFRGR